MYSIQLTLRYKKTTVKSFMIMRMSFKANININHVSRVKDK